MENKMKIYVPRTEVAEKIARSLESEIANLEVARHPFLQKFSDHGMSHEQLQTFAPQWYRVITAHKRAFAGLIYHTPDERLRADLTAILYDECGNGDPDKKHTEMWLKVPESIGLSRKQVRVTPAIPSMTEFSRYVNENWGSSDNPTKSYGIVFLFEKIGVDFHTSFLKGLEKSNLPEVALSYSRLHTIAEEEHAKRIVNGLALYADKADQLRAGLEGGAKVMKELWDGFDRLVYK